MIWPISITNQSVSTETASVIYTPRPGKIGKITSISVNGPALLGYHISIYKQTASNNRLAISLFSFSLDPGDVILDNTTYYLGEGDSILALSNTTNVSVVIDGEEI